MSSHPLKEMSDPHSRPPRVEPLSNKYKLYESEPTSPSWPSSPQDTHPALPLLEMPEEKVRNIPPEMFPRRGEWEEGKTVLAQLLKAVLQNAGPGPGPRRFCPTISACLHP